MQDAEEHHRVGGETSGVSCQAVTLNSWQEKELDKQAHMSPLPFCEPHPGLGASPGFQQEWRMAEQVQAGSGGRAESSMAHKTTELCVYSGTATAGRPACMPVQIWI